MNLAYTPPPSTNEELKQMQSIKVEMKAASLGRKLYEAGISDCFISDGAQVLEQSLEQSMSGYIYVEHICEWMHECSRTQGDPENLEL